MELVWSKSSMSPESALAKRIKRHVIGSLHWFFAATAPGFESLCLQELQTLPLSSREMRVVEGGVEFQGRLIDCYIANLNLRTANRILMRIATVRAVHFSELERTFYGIPWELYLNPGSPLKVHTTARHCRLYHTDAVSGRLLAAVTGRLGLDLPTAAEHDSFKQTFFVRGIDDRFTVSIDSSGDHLYKRGIKTLISPAPLRETTAAAALMLAGYRSGQPLVDPMCGSGTFSLEAALIVKNIPPGLLRTFAFMGWPAFRPKTWNYLRRQAEQTISNLESPCIFASDIDPQGCQTLLTCVRRHGLSNVIQVSQRDFFDIVPSELTPKRGVVAINPPYGRRLGTPAQTARLFESICEKLKCAYSGWRLILIAPSQQVAKNLPFPTHNYPLLHGGLKVRLLVGHIQ
jgi:putative N6-adenine-specific DNA methylase